MVVMSWRLCHGYVFSVHHYTARELRVPSMVRSVGCIVQESLVHCTVWCVRSMYREGHTVQFERLSQAGRWSQEFACQPSSGLTCFRAPSTPGPILDIWACIPGA